MIVHLLGKQNIAFCRHRDGKLVSSDSTSKQNKSNFKAILNLLIAPEDPKITTYVQQAQEKIFILVRKYETNLLR